MAADAFGKDAFSTRVANWIAHDRVELPVLDEVALRVYRAASSGALDGVALSELLDSDPALVAEVLRMANSSYFAGLVEVRSLRHAVVRLGTRQIASLALSAACRRLYGDSATRFAHRLRQLWHHGMATAIGMRWLAVHAERSGHPSNADDAFVLGLLHDIGKLVVLRAIEDIATRDLVEPAESAIERTLDTLGSREGAKLLASWRFPDDVVARVRHLEDDDIAASDTPLRVARLVHRTALALAANTEAHDAAAREADDLAREGWCHAFEAGSPESLAASDEGRALDITPETLRELVAVMRGDEPAESVAA